MVVPGVPETATAWEVGLGRVRALKTERVAGGLRVTLPEFGPTAIVVLTSDRGLIDALSVLVKRLQPEAAQTMARLAETTLKKVEAINSELAAEGHVLPDADQLLRAARQSQAESVEALSKRDYSRAFLAGKRAMRPLRVLERAHWDEAVKGLATPLASPFALSFSTLPDHWRFMREAAASQFGPSLLAGGGCESAEALSVAGGRQERSSDADGLDARVTVVASHRSGGGEWL